MLDGSSFRDQHRVFDRARLRSSILAFTAAIAFASLATRAFAEDASVKDGVGRLVIVGESRIRTGDELSLTLELVTDGVAVPVTGRIGWSSSDPSVLQIDAGGHVRALTVGSVTITAAYTGPSGSPMTARHEMRVSIAAPVAPVLEMRWYGWQTILVDAGTVALAFATMTPGCDGCGREVGVVSATVFVAGYALGAPIVHVAHGRPLTGLGSFGLRVVLPVLGAYIGLAAVPCPPSREEGCGLGALPLGFAIGAMVASVIDAAALAWEERPVVAETPAAISFAPAFTPISHGGLGGLQGVF